LVGGFLISVTGLGVYTFPSLKNEVALMAQKIPGYMNAAQAQLMPLFNYLNGFLDSSHLEQLDKSLTSHVGTLLSWGLKLFARIFNQTVALANIFSLILITPLIIFHMLKDWRSVEAFFQGLVPRHIKKPVHELTVRIHETLAAYFRGQASVCFILMLYYVTGLKLIGMDFAVTIGLVTGLLAFVPYVGYTIGLVAALGVSLAQFGLDQGTWWVLFLFLGGQALESFYLTPQLVGDRIQVHPVWILFSLMAGGVLAGFSGILLAVPTAGIVAIFMRFILTHYRQYYVQAPKRKGTS
jgi:predicted PurR-regulated permease PerM